MENISRNKEQELIMISIYDALVYSDMGEVFSLEKIMENIFSTPYDEISYYSKSIVIKSLSRINDIKKIFQEKMPKWNFSRLNLIEQAILLMSYTHYKEEKVEKRIVIDVAIRLAKKFLDADDYKFVNAILDNVL